MARDRSGHTPDFVTGNGPLTKASLTEALKPVLVSDGNPSYRAFCRTEGIRRVFEQHPKPSPQWLLNAALGNFQQLTVT
ncbi:hypothetical protein AADEFJLK_01723 [Methylovulum psychrotolerans]|uniref:IS1595 family transposase n=1 Tax=Methylovulum psychrotolerans TaxID=1704499 RepID=A0A2S5CN90_9GAMM|nr:hypothetical protein AADEFJLK_01723 [Methylovulum psychrotolerans]